MKEYTVYVPKAVKLWKLALLILLITAMSIVGTVAVVEYYCPREKAEKYCGEIGGKWQEYGCHKVSDILCTVDQKSGFHDCKKRNFEECKDRCLETEPDLNWSK